MKTYDVHTLKAMELFKCEAHEVTPEMRAKAKAVNYLTAYTPMTHGPKIVNPKE